MASLVAGWEEEEHEGIMTRIVVPLHDCGLSARCGGYNAVPACLPGAATCVARPGVLSSTYS